MRHSGRRALRTQPPTAFTASTAVKAGVPHFIMLANYRSRFSFKGASIPKILISSAYRKTLTMKYFWRFHALMKMVS